MQIKNYNEIAFHTHQIGQKCKFLVIPKHGRHWKNIQQFHSHIYTSEKQVQVLWDVQTRTNAALLFPSGLNRKQPSPPTADRMNCGTAAWWHGITKHWKRKVPLALTMISISSCGFRHSPAVSVHICVLQECGWVQWKIKHIHWDDLNLGSCVVLGRQ